MSSPVRKQAESEFDDLLGDLVNELAMAPAEESAVTLIPEQPEEAPNIRVESTGELANVAAAAAAAHGSKGTSDVVKIIGIIAGSLTALGVAALLVLGGGEEPTAQVPDVAQAQTEAKLAQAQAAGEQAKRDLDVALAAKRQAIELGAKTDADARDKTFAAAEAAAEEAKKVRKPRKPRKPRPKTPKPPTGDDFDDL